MRWAATSVVLAVLTWVVRLTMLDRAAGRRLSSPTAPWPRPASPARRPPSPIPVPAPPAPAPAADTTWVAPGDAGSCPAGYPVKAKLRSGVYHLEGMAAYARTRPDRCYPSAEAAEAGGFRRALR